MSYISTADAVKRIRPELILQTLGTIKVPESEIMGTVFTNRRNVDGNEVVKSTVQQAIRAIPYVGKKNPGVQLGGKTITNDAITAPPMKAQDTIQASDIEKSRTLRGIEFQAWLADRLGFIRQTIASNMEWYARHFLTTGSCTWPFLVDDTFLTLEYSLGTLTAADGAPAVLFDAASAQLTHVVKHLDHLYEKGRAVPYRNHFADKSRIITYARTDVWNAVYDLLNGRQTNDVVGSGRINQTDLDVGGWLIRKDDLPYLSPVDQSTAYAIPAKKMRMIDIGASAPHTMVNLRLDNLNATGGQKFVYVGVIPDPHGNFVDIDVHFRPVGLFIPEACVDSLAVIS